VFLTGPDGLTPVWPRPPNPTGGYQLDARITTLQDQSFGAFVNHAQVQNQPSQQLLDDLASFQRVLFSSSRVRTLSNGIREGVEPLPDPDPPLTPLEEEGKVVFTRSCAHCHGGAGTSTPTTLPGEVPWLPFGRYSDIKSACPRPVDSVSPPRWSFKPCPPRLARNQRTYEITLPNGTKIRRTGSDPGRALLTGFVLPLPAPEFTDDWQKMDNAPLRGFSRTAPYFHNNSADTLDEVLDHYDALFKRAVALLPPNTFPPFLSTDGTSLDRPFTAAERPALLAYLKKL
jgi:cytochrome c peroxidase